jgi:hypothetical protein
VDVGADLNAIAGFAFVTVWGVGAVVLGGIFAFRPASVADIYIAQMARFKTSNTLRERFAPRSAILIWYRFGGALFMITGVVIPVLAFSGVLPIRPLSG